MDLVRRERAREDEPRNLPWDIGQDHAGVDTTWGEVQPMHPVEGVRTVGELELVALAEDGAVLVDTRVADSRSGRTIPGSVHLPHDGITPEQLDPDRVAVLFCNGPQCTQTPDALRRLVDAGHPAEALAYYRGGLHDWMTLGFPTEPIGN